MRLSGSFIVQLAVAAPVTVVLAAQVAINVPRLSTSKRLRDLTKARAAGSTDKTRNAADAALAELPGDRRLQLLQAYSLFVAGDFDKAAVAYERIAGKAPAEVQAAALTGHASALIARSEPPAEEDVKSALKLLRKARNLAPDLPDSAAVEAIACMWAGDEQGAGKAVAEVERLEAEQKPLGIDAAAAFYCARGLALLSEGDIDAAIVEARRAAWIMPERETALGEHVGRSLGYLELEAAARPGISEQKREDMVKRLAAEGTQGLSGPETYPVFLRAAAAAARGSKSRAAGLDLLDHAIDKHPDDPAPVVFKIAVLADDHAASWEMAAASREATTAVPGARSVFDVLPGAALPRPGMTLARSKGLAAIEAAESPLLEEIEVAAKRAVAMEDERGPELVLSLARFLHDWKMRQAELSATVERRRKREDDALSAITFAEKLLGDRMPRGSVSATLYRNAGVILAGRLDTAASLAAFKKSLELDPNQEDLTKLLSPEANSLKVVATWPGPLPLHSAPPFLGAEFSLPFNVRSLEECTRKATLGPAGGTAKAIEPQVTRTGLWYLPEAKELTDSDMEARFTITDPLGRATEAVVAFRVDIGPPVIVERFPAEGAEITDRRPVFRVKWRDLSGIDPDSVSIALDPVTAQFFPQSLVEKGLHKTSRFAEPKWRRGDAAVTGTGKTAGEIVAGAMSELQPGSYRLTLAMDDKCRHSKKYVWEFNVR